MTNLPLQKSSHNLIQLPPSTVEMPMQANSISTSNDTVVSESAMLQEFDELFDQDFLFMMDDSEDSAQGPTVATSGEENTNMKHEQGPKNISPAPSVQCQEEQMQMTFVNYSNHKSLFDPHAEPPVTSSSSITVSSPMPLTTSVDKNYCEVRSNDTIPKPSSACETIRSSIPDPVLKVVVSDISDAGDEHQPATSISTSHGRVYATSALKPTGTKRPREHLNLHRQEDEVAIEMTASNNANTSKKTKLTEEQKAHGRRERNREHAKKSRKRKKEFIQTLEQTIQQLRNENDKLRHSITHHFGSTYVEKVLTSPKGVLPATPVSIPPAVSPTIQPVISPAPTTSVYLNNSPCHEKVTKKSTYNQHLIPRANSTNNITKVSYSGINSTTNTNTNTNTLNNPSKQQVSKPKSFITLVSNKSPNVPQCTSTLEHSVKTNVQTKSNNVMKVAVDSNLSDAATVPTPAPASVSKIDIYPGLPIEQHIQQGQHQQQQQQQQQQGKDSEQVDQSQVVESGDKHVNMAVPKTIITTTTTLPSSVRSTSSSDSDYLQCNFLDDHHLDGKSTYHHHHHPLTTTDQPFLTPIFQNNTIATTVTTTTMTTNQTILKRKKQQPVANPILNQQ